MRRTPADKTLRILAIALTCVGSASVDAFASTGGTSAPAGAQLAKSSSAHSHRDKASPGEQIATWFGPGFYGQKTACGQTMTPVIVGVASRTLPCGTLVLVSYRGHKLTVPVIDRGPYARNGATWDLTWGAASALSIEDTVRIATKIVGQAPNTPLLGVPAEAKPTASSATVAPSGGTVAS
jgi:rare lipoprotein A (peptidoglycan hydrolase)